MYAFGLEETAEYRRAEDPPRRSPSRPVGRLAIHALATYWRWRVAPTRHRLPLRKLGPMEESFFAVHNRWHWRSTYRGGQAGVALAVYDNAIRKSDSSEWLDLVDAAACSAPLATGYGREAARTALVDISNED